MVTNQKANNTTTTDIIEIAGYHFWSDYTETVKVEVDLSKIYGFEIHYRGDNSWHVKVRVKEGQKHPYSLNFEIEHCVPILEVERLLINPKAKILKFVNYHSSDDFLEKLTKLLTETSNR